MHVLIMGAGGQLASELGILVESAGHTVSRFRRKECDIADAESVRRTLDPLTLDVIINAAAYNKVDAAESEVTTAFAVNAYGPRFLARYAAERGATLVHYSTDYVVDGARRSPYTEDDPVLPLSVYGTSKLAGELFVRAIAPHHYVLRVCGLFGLGGMKTRHGNFIETMLRAAEAGRPLRVVSDQLIAPTSTRDVAAATLAMLEQKVPYGLYHCTAEGEASWYEVAAATFRFAGVDASLSATTAEEYGASARRPAYSILANRRLQEAGIARPRHWRTALEDYVTTRPAARDGLTMASETVAG